MVAHSRHEIQVIPTGYIGCSQALAVSDQFVISWQVTSIAEIKPHMTSVALLVLDLDLAYPAVLKQLQRLCPGVVMVALGEEHSGVDSPTILMQAGLTAIYRQLDRQAGVALAAVLSECDRSRDSLWACETLDDHHGHLLVRGQSTYATLYRFRQTIEHLPATAIPERHMPDIQAAIEELGRNAIEWGNAGDSRRQILLWMQWTGSYLVLIIGDQGQGFDPASVPDPRQDPIQHIEQRVASGKRLGGYGIHMIRDMCDGLWWNDCGNTVAGVMQLGTQPDVMTMPALQPTALFATARELWQHSQEPDPDPDQPNWQATA